MSIATTDFQDDLADLESAEDFLDYFGIDFVPSVVHVNRLHILQRFHNYLDAHAKAGVTSFDEYRGWLLRAYDDFVKSDAQTEKVFSVLQRAAGITKISIGSIGRGKPT